MKYFLIGFLVFCLHAINHAQTFELSSKMVFNNTNPDKLVLVQQTRYNANKKPVIIVDFQPMTQKRDTTTYIYDFSGQEVQRNMPRNVVTGQMDKYSKVYDQNNFLWKEYFYCYSDTNRNYSGVYFNQLNGKPLEFTKTYHNRIERTQYSYNSSGLLVGEEISMAVYNPQLGTNDPFNPDKTIKYAYDKGNRLQKAETIMALYTVDSISSKAKRTESISSVTEYLYNEKGLLIEKATKQTFPFVYYERETYEYNSEGLLSAWKEFRTPLSFGGWPEYNSFIVQYEYR